MKSTESYCCRNLFVDMQAQFANTGIAFSQTGSSTSNILIYNNNLWYNCDPVAYSGGGKITEADHDCFIKTTHPAEAHAQTGSADPFVNYTGMDFRPITATQAGMSLPAPYNTDMYGTVRGADGTWDRGAIDYVGQIVKITPVSIESTPNISGAVMDMYTLQGKLVRRVVHGRRGSGHYEPAWNGAIAGAYIVRIRVGEKQYNKVTAFLR